MLRQAQDLPAVRCGRSSRSMPGTYWRCCSMAAWFGRLLAASILRQAGVTTAARLQIGLTMDPVG
ncbi:hypothetical protein [Rhizobium mongolense]|uniref:hypothetical protein n=1 Tax=Rhizobium mongolense TaxID=57676 RepID=UPI001F1EE6BF|nr:hypothetical protein [Rhizobium mongolense]